MLNGSSSTGAAAISGDALRTTHGLRDREGYASFGSFAVCSAALQSRPPALFSAPDGRSTNVLAAGNPRADATGVYFNFSPSDNSAAAAPSPYTRPLLRSACVPLRRFRLSRGDRVVGDRPFHLLPTDIGAFRRSLWRAPLTSSQASSRVSRPISRRLVSALCAVPALGCFSPRCNAGRKTPDTARRPAFSCSGIRRGSRRRLREAHAGRRRRGPKAASKPNASLGKARLRIAAPRERQSSKKSPSSAESARPAAGKDRRAEGWR